MPEASPPLVAPPAPPRPFARADCLHCGLPIGAAGRGDFCCTGCEAVYLLLRGEHLERYYALRGARGVPVADARAERRDSKWLELTEQRIRATDGDCARVTLDVQGLHCVGCVWLLEELFSRAVGHERIVVNPSIGRVDLLVAPAFDLRGYVASVERFGYLFGPPVKRGPARSRDLVWRLGVCAAIAMNSMI